MVILFFAMSGLPFLVEPFGVRQGIVKLRAWLAE